MFDSRSVDFPQEQPEAVVRHPEADKPLVFVPQFNRAHRRRIQRMMNKAAKRAAKRG